MVSKICVDCGTEFERSQEYIDQNRTDALYKYKLQCCDLCTDKRVEEVFKRMSGIIEILSEEDEVKKSK